MGGDRRPQLVYGVSGLVCVGCKRGRTHPGEADTHTDIHTRTDTPTHRQPRAHTDAHTHTSRGNCCLTSVVWQLVRDKCRAATAV